jgi:hypothetical protein
MEEYMKTSNSIKSTISISKKREKRLKDASDTLNVGQKIIISVLAYKACSYLTGNTRICNCVMYQERTKNYAVKGVSFFPSDHEYLHAHRFSCKVSVSRLIAFAIDRFLDEIIENGIDPAEIASLRIEKNSYTQKTYYFRNISTSIAKEDQFTDYIMKIRMNTA